MNRKTSVQLQLKDINEAQTIKLIYSQQVHANIQIKFQWVGNFDVLNLTPVNLQNTQIQDSNPTQMNHERIRIQLSSQQFRKRFKIISQYTDPFSRHYLITTDSLNGSRSIYKHYLADTEEQLEAIYDNIQNYIKLSQQDGVCKILAYTKLQEQQQILAAFEYNQYTLGQYLETPNFLQNKTLFYLQLLLEMALIIETMAEIGIDVDQLNYGNILVVHEGDQVKMKVFYDEREKSYEKVLDGVKTFTSIEKLRALISGDEEYFAELMKLSDSISPENIYQLGLLLIDLMYRAETSAQQQQDDFLKRDRPSTRSTNLNNEKGYYDFEDGTIRSNQCLNDKLTYLKNSGNHLIKQLSKLGEMMIAQLQERLSIYELKVEIDRLEKIYRDSTRRNLTAVSLPTGHQTEIQKAAYRNVSLSNKESSQNGKNTKQQQENQQIFITVSGSSKSAVSSIGNSQKRLSSQMSNEHNNLIFENQNNILSDSIQKLSQGSNKSYKGSIKKQSPFREENIQIPGANTALELNKINDYESIRASTYLQSSNIHPEIQISDYSYLGTYNSNLQQKDFHSRENTKNTKSLSNTNQSLGMANQYQGMTKENQAVNNQYQGTKMIYTTKPTNESFSRLSNNIMTYSQGEKSKKQSYIFNEQKTDLSNERQTKLFIPKQSILTNLKAHESIRSSFSRLILQIQNLPDIKRKQYNDNSVYYGSVSPQTNKRTGLGIYIYPSGDIYFGTWSQNQLIDGTYVFKNGESYEGSVNGGKQGWGRYRYSNGNVYEGEWKDDIKEGKGTMWYPNQDKYQGQWVKGKKNGYGKYYYNNGTIYEGNFANGRKQGFGIITFPNGTKIEANWQQTHVEGQGKVFYPNGDFFHGEYFMSQKNGKGLYVWASDNTKYEGQFRKDCLQGEAKIYFTQKEFYNGQIQNGKRDGQGHYNYENGDSFVGEWKNDMKLIGHYKFKNGDEFEGKFKENQFSFGVLKYANGQSYEGEFRNGYRHGVGSYRSRKGQVVCEGHWEKDDFKE